MEWFDYVLTAVISAIFGSLFGGLAGYFLEIWKDRKEAEKARVSRIIVPLRDVRVRLQSLVNSYQMDKDGEVSFTFNLDQLNHIVEDEIKGHSLDVDLSKESKSLLGHLTELHIRYQKARDELVQKDKHIRSDDAEGKNRLIDEYRMQLFEDKRIKNLVNYLADEVEKWLQKHT